MSPRYPGGPRPPLRMPNQPPVGVPGSQPLLPNAMDPAARSQGHPGMGGPMQRMNPPRGMAGMGPQAGGTLRTMGTPPHCPHCLPRGPGGRGPWPNPNANSVSFGIWGVWEGGFLLGVSPRVPPVLTPPLSPPDHSTNSSENMYTMMNPIGPGLGTGGIPPPFLTPSFPLAMEPHHMNGSLGSGDMDGLPKSSPSNLGALSNPPGTPRDDAELSSNFLNPFQSDSVRDPAGTPADPRGGRRRGRGARGGRGRGGSATKSHWRPPEIVSPSPAAATAATALGSPWPSSV
uniref:Single stranded DNA binding protein 4 n=1 Tax=Catharus ustulatus TaxID=91951 RepID=A0A8C3U7T0_CATUS